MAYVDRHLMDGEQVAYRTRRHWIIYQGALFILAIGLAIFLVGQLWENQPGAATVGLAALALAAFLALVLAIPAWINRISSEFAVTNKRVIVKVGMMQRRSVETLLTKVEAIEVIQGIGGRMFNYGTIIVIGTGGTKEPFERIAAPLEFRRKVHEQILALQTR